MLTRCYKAELSKLVRSKSILIAIAVMIVLLIFMSILSAVLNDIQIDIDEANGMGLGMLDPSQYDAAIEILEEQLASLEDETRFIDQRGQIEANIAIIKYLRDNDLKPSDVSIPSVGGLDFAISASGYLNMSITVIMQIVMFYAVIMMSGIFAGEYRDGTLKMQILRPNSRSQIFTAKWLAVMTVSVALMLIGVLIASIYSAIAFKFGAREVLLIVANSSVFTVHESVFVLMSLVFAIVGVFAMTMFSSFMSVISNFNRAGSMTLPIVVLLFGDLAMYLLQVAYLGILDFSSNVYLMNFFMLNSISLPHMSLYSAIPVLLLYIAAFMTTSYLIFNKKEC